jgi:hypothetical protein
MQVSPRLDGPTPLTKRMNQTLLVRPVARNREARGGRTISFLSPVGQLGGPSSLRQLIPASDPNWPRNPLESTCDGQRVKGRRRER